MNCPNCNTELVLGAKVALCLNCGATQPLPGSTPSVPEIAAAPDSAGPVSATQPVTPAAVMPTVSAPEITPQPIVTKRSRRKLVLASIFVVVLLLAGGGGAYAYYSYQVAPKHALVSYLNKLVSSKTGKYSGTITYRGDSTETSSLGLSKVDITLAGSYDIADQKNPKADLTLGGSAGTYSLKAQLRTLDKTAYFKLDSLELVQNFGLTLSKDWYKIALDDNAETNKCAKQSSKNSKNFLGSQVLTDLPLKNVKAESLYETVAGHPTTHFRGDLDNTKLQNYIDKANQELTADCKITLSAKDLETTTISYDLWSGKDFDRLRIKANDSKSKSQVESTIDTSGYNKPVKIVAPENAKELKDLLSGLYGSDSTYSAGDDYSSSSTASTAVKSRDLQRKTDLRMIQKGLEEYFVDNNTYPLTLASLTKQPNPILKVVPADPVGKAPYVYGYKVAPAGCKTTCESYTLSALLEDTKATGAKIVNGAYTLVNNN